MTEIRPDSNRASYQDRQTVENKAERLFREYAQRRGLKIWRLGFDEKDGNMPMFYNLPKHIRSLPDYAVPVAEHKIVYLIEVKGTNKLKLEDYDGLLDLAMVCDRTRCRILVAFCFEGEEPAFVTMEKLAEMILRAEVKEFESDGKKYYDLKI